MIGVVIPAHNEAAVIGSCLATVKAAAASPLLQQEAVAVVVVLDDCSDVTGLLARQAGAATLCVAARNVGAARAAGASIAWSSAARVVTSARKDFRAPGGFGATLLRVDAQADAEAQTAAEAHTHTHTHAQAHSQARTETQAASAERRC